MYYQLQICIDASVGIDILIPSTKVKEKKGAAFQRHLLCRSRNQLQICIDASVGIDILILKYKGEGEEGCGFSETFVMQIEQWGSASWSVRLFLEVGKGLQIFKLQFLSILLEDQK
jgi:hypothetical protein